MEAVANLAAVPIHNSAGDCENFNSFFPFQIRHFHFRHVGDGVISRQILTRTDFLLRPASSGRAPEFIRRRQAERQQSGRAKIQAAGGRRS